MQPGLTVFKLTLVHLDLQERGKKTRQEYTRYEALKASIKIQYCTLYRGSLHKNPVMVWI